MVFGNGAGIASVFEACQDLEIQRWVPIPVPYRWEHAHGWIAGAQSGWSDGRRGVLAIADVSSDRFLGAIGLRPIAEHRASIGYWVAPAERGRGVATAAVRLLGRWALITLSIQMGGREARLPAGGRPSGVCRSARRAPRLRHVLAPGVGRRDRGRSASAKPKSLRHSGLLVHSSCGSSGWRSSAPTA